MSKVEGLVHGHSRSFGLYLLVDFIGASLRLSRAVVLLVSGWMGGGVVWLWDWGLSVAGAVNCCCLMGLREVCMALSRWSKDL